MFRLSKARFTVVFWLLCAMGLGMAQTFQQHYETALGWRSANEFEKADSVFRLILKNHKKNLPEALCYHYGVVLYELKDPRKSAVFLNKYLSFKKNNEEYMDSAQYYLSLMNKFWETPVKKNNGTHMVLDTCDLCQGKGKYVQSCKKCNVSGKIICYLCKGTGLNQINTEIGNAKFNPCGVCQGSGSVVCSYCKGHKASLSPCLKCHGQGKMEVAKP